MLITVRSIVIPNDKETWNPDVKKAESSQQLQMNIKIDENSRVLEEMQNMMTGFSLQLTQIVNNQSNTRNQIQEVQNEGEGFNYTTRLTKIEFPRFKGDELTSWLFKGEEFFQLDRVTNATKVRLAAIHFEDKTL
ncbi:hypothetical protein HanRHA438_Chr15g0734311 [Helianthus annuus]|nr:hypothetical protein HanRHA438_Chr15g0734311 [Helianthus annuus]